MLLCLVLISGKVCTPHLTYVLYHIGMYLSRGFWKVFQKFFFWKNECLLNSKSIPLLLFLASWHSYCITLLCVCQEVFWKKCKFFSLYNICKEALQVFVFLLNCRICTCRSLCFSWLEYSRSGVLCSPLDDTILPHPIAKVNSQFAQKCGISG